MDAAVIVTVALLGLLAGGAIGYLVGRTRGDGAPAASDGAVAQQRDVLAGQVHALTAERDGLRTQAEAERQARGRAEQQAAAARAEAEAAMRSAEQRLADLQQAQAALKEQFTALSADALKANREQFLLDAEERLKRSQTEQVAELAKREEAVANLVRPLQETLGKVETQLQSLEVERGKAYAELREQVAAVKANNESLRTETASLVKALRAPQARGRWGELQLRRIVELAGMSSRCDFDEQATVTTDDGVLRPDVVVRLAGGKSVVVDSKVTLVAYIEAHESLDDAHAEQRLQAHARHLRDHVKALSSKAYWSQFPNTPEFVVLFVPGEAFLAPALERDPSLLEDAMDRRVVIATPTTLMTMLRTIAYAWQQEALADNAREVFDLGRELYTRLGTLGEHVDKLGRSIERVVKDYNTSVGSLETRVLVSARRLRDLDVVDAELARVTPIDAAPRPIGAPELTAAAEAARPVRLVLDTGEADVHAVPDTPARSNEEEAARG